MPSRPRRSSRATPSPPLDRDALLARAEEALDGGRIAEAREAAQQAVLAADSVSEASDPRRAATRAAARRLLAVASLSDGRIDDASRAAEDAVRFAHAARDRKEEALGALALAEVASARGAALVALRHAGRARSLAVRAGDPLTLRAALADFGLYLCIVGDGERARDVCAKALAMPDAGQSPAGAMRVLCNAASVSHAAGRFDEALDRLDKADAVAKHAGVDAPWTFTLLRAFIYVDIGAYDVARALIARRGFEAFASEEGSGFRRAELLRLRAAIALGGGERPDSVEKLIVEALAIPGIPAPLANELERLRGMALFARGRTEEAERIAIGLVSVAARSGSHAFGAKAFALAARAGHPEAWLLRWLGAGGLAATGVAVRVAHECYAALSGEPDPIGALARTHCGIARARLIENTPQPLRVTMKRVLRQTEARITALRKSGHAALETPLDDAVVRATEEVGLVGSSVALLRAVSSLARAAKAEASLVITGETGSGKELFARLAHRLSDRAAGPFVAINCAAIPESLLEAELFGHERGAFTGADRARQGLFVEAEGGTLLLDELGEMSRAMQSKLLRVLEDRIVRPVGGSRARKVNVRVVAATHRDLAAMVASGAFREDLYYRMAAITVRVPSLRERPEDIPTIARALLARDPTTRSHRFDVPGLTALAEHNWPGNVRELMNALRVAAALASSNVLGRVELAEALGGGTASPGGGATPRAPKETTIAALRSRQRSELRELVGRAIATADGNKRKAAKALGVSRQGLYRVLLEG